AVRFAIAPAHWLENECTGVRLYFAGTHLVAWTTIRFRGEVAELVLRAGESSDTAAITIAWIGAAFAFLSNRNSKTVCHTIVAVGLVVASTDRIVACVAYFGHHCTSAELVGRSTRCLQGEVTELASFAGEPGYASAVALAGPGSNRT